MNRSLPTRLLWVTLLLAGCSAPPNDPNSPDVRVDVGAGVSRSLAEWRSQTISDLRYRIFLSIPAERGEPITGSIFAGFSLSETGRSLPFDFAQPAENVSAVSAQGEPVAWEARDEHVFIPAEALISGHNEIRIDFTAGDGSLNRADEFLYTLFVPDRARVALPLFDQPDLKARFELSLEVPASWQAVANGAQRQHHVEGDRATFSFDETQPISTYVLAFSAGRFEIATAERNGRQLRMFHRETDGEKVERNLEAIFDLHGTALEWLEEYTGIPYPFAKLDFVAMPAFQYGGMEHTGAIFYRDRSLFLDETATQNQYLGRASLIAHEVAHMWFGNLVTMEWFNDVWMKEVFANFMAAKIVNPSFPEIDHDLRFLLAHYPTAYGIDRTTGANPIRQDLENLNRAGSLYGAIIYQKAPIVMKHLERLMGEEAFREGLREYLHSYGFGNATWPDLIAALDPRTEEDLVAWSEVWVNEPGRPTVEVRLELGRQADDARIDSLSLHQTDPGGGGLLWNQRLELLLGYDDRSESLPVHLREGSVEVEAARDLPTPLFVLANGAGVGYGNFVLEPASQDYLLENLPAISQARVRAIAWVSLWDAMLEGEIEPLELIRLAIEAIPQEDDELNLQRVLATLRGTFWRYLSAAERESLAAEIEELLWTQLESTDQATRKASYFSAYRNLVLTADGVGRLQRLWSGQEEIAGLPLSENDMTDLAHAIAVRGHTEAESILDQQRARITNPDRVLQFDFVRRALSADAATRDTFFAGLAEASNRERERWVLDALGFLHHPLRAASSEHYIRPSLELLEEIQRTGDIFFPLGWLSATLGGHNTASAAATVQTFLDQRPDLPPRLRGKLLQAADPLFRSARIVGAVE
jgi:aminopeptidase N